LYNWIMDKLEDMDFGENHILETTRNAIMGKLRIYYV
jgi:hypothetical protein